MRLIQPLLALVGIFILCSQFKTLAIELEPELSTVADKRLPLEDRVAAAKRCFDEGPLDGRALHLIYDSIGTERIPWLDGGEAQMTPFYVNPFWALLVDKAESIPLFIEGALDAGGISSQIYLCREGLLELKARGIDATARLSELAQKTPSEEKLKAIQSLIQALAERPILKDKPTPEYLKPPPPPDPLLEIFKARKAAREAANGSTEPSEPISQPSASASSKQVLPSQTPAPPTGQRPDTKMRPEAAAPPSPPDESSSSTGWLVLGLMASAITVVGWWLKRRS